MAPCLPARWQRVSRRPRQRWGGAPARCRVPERLTAVRIVVIGASGNVGTALLRRLSREPDADLVGVARRPPGPDAGPPYDRVEWHACEVAEHQRSAPKDDLQIGPRYVRDAVGGALKLFSDG